MEAGKGGRGLGTSVIVSTIKKLYWGKKSTEPTVKPETYGTTGIPHSSKPTPCHSDKVARSKMARHKVASGQILIGVLHQMESTWKVTEV